MIFNVILSILLLITVYQIIIKEFIYSKASPLRKGYGRLTGAEKVTVIICSRRYNKSLEKSLLAIAQQNYPAFEILVVNDGPDPNIEKLIVEMRNQWSNITCLNHIKTSVGKKEGLSKAISAANSPWLLLTDDDCVPASPNWITEMMNSVHSGVKVVLGYSPYKKEKGLLNRFIRYENIHNAISYFSAAHLGFPYMGVGRNLLYEKSIFQIQKSYTQTPFGDDDLMVNAHCNSTNTSTCLSSDAFVFSDAKKTWTEYFKQRRRHYSVAQYYSWWSKLYLSTNAFTLVGFYFCIIYLFLQGYYFIPLLCYCLNLISFEKLYYKERNIFSTQDLLIHLPLLELMYVSFIILQFPLLFIHKKNW